MKIEDISRLEAHAGSFTPRVDGNPISTLSWEEVCFALATCEDAPSLLVRAKYGQEVQAGRALLRRLKGSVLILGAQKHWDLSPTQTATLATVGLELCMIPPLCPICGGRKEAMINALRVVCSGCHGSGLLSHSDVQMAQKLGVDLKDWLNTWEARVSAVLDLLNRWEQQATWAIAAQHNT